MNKSTYKGQSSSLNTSWLFKLERPKRVEGESQCVLQQLSHCRTSVCVCVCVCWDYDQRWACWSLALLAWWRGESEGWCDHEAGWGGAITSHSCESPVATLLPGRVDHTLPCISLTGRPDALPATLHGCLALHLYPLLYTDPQRCYDLLFVCIWRYTGAFRPDSCKVFHGGKFCVTLSRLKLLDFVVTD